MILSCKVPLEDFINDCNTYVRYIRMKKVNGIMTTEEERNHENILRMLTVSHYMKNYHKGRERIEVPEEIIKILYNFKQKIGDF